MSIHVKCFTRKLYASNSGLSRKNPTEYLRWHRKWSAANRLWRPHARTNVRLGGTSPAPPRVSPRSYWEASQAPSIVQTPSSIMVDTARAIGYVPACLISLSCRTGPIGRTSVTDGERRPGCKPLSPLAGTPIFNANKMDKRRG